MHNSDRASRLPRIFKDGFQACLVTVYAIEEWIMLECGFPRPNCYRLRTKRILRKFMEAKIHGGTSIAVCIVPEHIWWYVHEPVLIFFSPVTFKGRGQRIGSYVRYINTVFY